MKPPLNSYLIIMSFFLLSVLALFMTGCGPQTLDTKESETGAFSIIRVDGCQYLVRKSGYTGYMAHKGNCDNPIHCHNHHKGDCD